jgi:hypothetical protein
LLHVTDRPGSPLRISRITQGDPRSGLARISSNLISGILVHYYFAVSLMYGSYFSGIAAGRWQADIVPTVFPFSLPNFLFLLLVLSHLSPCAVAAVSLSEDRALGFAAWLSGVRRRNHERPKLWPSNSTVQAIKLVRARARCSRRAVRVARHGPKPLSCSPLRPNPVVPLYATAIPHSRMTREVTLSV